MVIHTSSDDDVYLSNLFGELVVETHCENERWLREINSQNSVN